MAGRRKTSRKPVFDALGLLGTPGPTHFKVELSPGGQNLDAVQKVSPNDWSGHFKISTHYSHTGRNAATVLRQAASRQRSRVNACMRSGAGEIMRVPVRAGQMRAY